MGGSLFGGVLEYFVDTDFPNLFLAQNVTTTDAMGMMVTNTSAKNTPGMNIQDAFITYKPMGDMFKIDVGYMLPPLAHNAVQGATTLYAWDYFFYTFRSGNALRQLGQPDRPRRRRAVARPVVGGHLEYRLGLFQGLRQAQQTTTDAVARNFFRVTGRVQINLLDPETGFFYAGTYLGTKKVLSIGASFDFEDTRTELQVLRGRRLRRPAARSAACSPRRSTSRTGTAARPSWRSPRRRRPSWPRPAS